MEHDEVLAGIEARLSNLVIDVSKKVIGSEIATKQGKYDLSYKTGY